MLPARPHGAPLSCAAGNRHFRSRAPPPSVATLQEMGRALEARLAAFPTSEEADEKLLAAEGGAMDWRDRRVIEFRKERKGAMRLTVERLRKAERTAYKLLSTPIASHGREEL